MINDILPHVTQLKHRRLAPSKGGGGLIKLVIGHGLEKRRGEGGVVEGVVMTSSEVWLPGEALSASQVCFLN